MVHKNKKYVLSLTKHILESSHVIPGPSEMSVSLRELIAKCIYVSPYAKTSTKKSIKGFLKLNFSTFCTTASLRHLLICKGNEAFQYVHEEHVECSYQREHLICGKPHYYFQLCEVKKKSLL